jgi:hypothetical protein
LGDVYHKGGDMKKAKFHFEAAAMAGNEVARCIVGIHDIILEILNELSSIGQLQHQVGITLPCII